MKSARSAPLLGLLLLGGGAAAKPEPEAVLSLQVRAAQKEGERALRPGAAVRSGETLSLRVQVDRPAYVYVVHVGPDGARTVLFPGARDQLLRGGEALRVPEAGRVLRISGPAGAERLYVIASAQTLDRADRALCDHYGLSSCTRGEPPPETVPPKERGLALGADPAEHTQRRRLQGGVALLRFELDHVP